MPSLRSIAVCSLMALGAFAIPAEKRARGDCLSRTEAQQVATTWATLIASYTDDLALASLTENFTDYSESVNTLINSCPQGDAAVTLPLLAPTFTTRAAFMRGQGQQPPINFKQLNIWNSCDAVFIRWETTNTANITDVKPVIGLITLETVKAPAGSQYPYLIDTVYSEFNAGAWLQNLVAGGICSTNAGLPDASGSASNGTCTTVLPSNTTTTSTTSTPTTATLIISTTTSSNSTDPCPSSTKYGTAEATTVWESVTSVVTETAYATSYV